MASETITRNDLLGILTEVVPQGGGGGSASGTPVPTADTVAEFDSTAHMNSTDMTATEVTDFVDSLEAQETNLADYVVEQGTSGIWTYRKWNSGIAECWGFQTQTCPLSSAYGSAYYTSVAPFCTFPTGLFISNPTVNIMRTGGGNGQGLIAISIYGINTSSCSAYVWNTLSGSLTMTFSIHAIGRWK